MKKQLEKQIRRRRRYPCTFALLPKERLGQRLLFFERRATVVEGGGYRKYKQSGRAKALTHTQSFRFQEVVHKRTISLQG